MCDRWCNLRKGPTHTLALSIATMITHIWGQRPAPTMGWPLQWASRYGNLLNYGMDEGEEGY